MRPVLLAVLGWLITSPLFARERSPSDSPERGIVRFQPPDDQKNVPERYRLAPCEFAYELTRKRDLAVSGIEIHRLTFPSPVQSAHPANNTVHADYYRPKGPGPFPCVIVLDIMGGNESIARLFASTLAQNSIGGLFVYMPYYGPRRPPGSKLRLVSPDINHSLDAIRQTVLDLRWATAWMASRPEIDGRRLGIMGISLGSFMAALTAEMEPRLGRVAVLLGGGGFVDAYYDDPRAALYRKAWEALGGTRERVAQMLAPVDPLTCAANLKDRKVLILAAKRDEIVPPRMAQALWEATGRQQIAWFDAGHYTAAVYLVSGLQHVVKHFGAM
jgi:dienelactone hydrolase